jgi:hypothetical protein
MAAGTFTFYDTAALALMGEGDMTSASVTPMLALVGSTYSPNVDTHDEWADVSASELGTTNTGYTAGGKTLSAVTLTEITAGYKVSSDATGGIQWTAGSADLPAWKYAVMYLKGTVEGKTNILIGYFEGNSGSTVPATTNTNTLTINCPSGGWFDVTHA